MDSDVQVAFLRSRERSGLLAGLVADSLAHGDRFVMPVFVLGETWRVLTEPRGYGVAPARVLAWLARWIEDAGILLPGTPYWGVLAEFMGQRLPRGAEIFDCQIAAVCVEHGVDEIWTFDARFLRDARLRVTDPLDGALG
jgi:predicted nucleic acid-binding protein